MRVSWILTLIIVASSGFVNAATSFKDQIRIAVSKGDDYVIKSDELSDHLHIEHQAPNKSIEINDDQTTDRLSHDFNVVLKDKEPVCVIFWAERETSEEANSVFYRVNLKGELENVFQQRGRFNAEHKPIRGSGAITDLKLTPEVRAAFQHEMDFWLKGMYRKPPAGSAANVTPVH